MKVRVANESLTEADPLIEAGNTAHGFDAKNVTNFIFQGINQHDRPA